MAAERAIGPEVDDPDLLAVPIKTVSVVVTSREVHGRTVADLGRDARPVFGMSPVMALGGLAGAQTCTPGLNALRDASGSTIDALAYAVPYAIGNILLTISGPVVVAIMYALRH